MAYDLKNLSVLAYANGFTVWHYRTTDLLRDVTEQGYFDPANDMLRTDDRIMVGAHDAAADIVVCTREKRIRVAVLRSALRAK